METPLYSNPQNSGTHIVTRGQQYDEIYTEAYANALLDPTQEAILQIARDIKQRGQNDYGGAYYKVEFRANKAIAVQGVSFFGGITAEKATYDVDVQVFEAGKKEVFPSPIGKNRRVDEILRVKDVERGQMFYVAFSQPLHVKPDVWYMIRFKLEGPDTVRLRSTDFVKTVSTEKGNVDFQFTEGSRQLPQIHFTV